MGMPRSAPSTHPVAGGEALDTRAALQDFDGISYAKGAATLWQRLIAHIGDEAFIAGVGAYLREHAFGNGTLADFLGFMERASGKDLSGWSRSGCSPPASTSSLPTRSPASSPARCRRLPGRPPAHPRRGRVLRRRGGLPRRGDAGWRRHRRTEPRRGAGGADRRAECLRPDLGDRGARRRHARCGPRGSRAGARPAGPGGGVAALVDGVCLGTVDPRLVVDTLGMAWPLESNESVLNRIAVAVLGRIIPSFLPPDEQAGAKAVVAEAARALLARSAPGSTTAVLAADPRPQQCRRVPAVALGRAPAPAARSAGGLGLPVAGGPQPRWARASSTPTSSSRSAARTTRWPAGSARCLRAHRFPLQTRRLGHGGLDDEPLSLQLRASTPWRRGSGPRATSTCSAAYVPRYFAEPAAALSEWVGADALGRVAALAFPARVVEQPTADASAAALAADALSPAVRRSIVDGDLERGGAALAGGL